MISAFDYIKQIDNKGSFYNQILINFEIIMMNYLLNKIVKITIF